MAAAAALSLLCGLFVREVEAHKVNIFAYAQEGKVFAEGYFVDGSKAKNSAIEVFDQRTGEKLLSGKTDDDGRFSFQIPRPSPLKIVLIAGAGHRNEYVLSEEEVKAALSSLHHFVEQGEKKPVGAPEKQRETPGVRSAASSCERSEELEAIIGRVVDSKLQPVLTILVDLQERSGKPRVTEVLGGLGYIVGIFGVIAYFKGTHRQKDRTTRP